MARRVFFSFHYENDVWRANVVRNSWVTKPDAETAGFVDAADFEEVKRGGDFAIKRWIDDQLHGTSVTVVLIGSQTNQREYVKYELIKSYERNNGILGIYIDGIKDRNGYISMRGSNHFGEIGRDKLGTPVYMSSHFKTYDWIHEDGYRNLGSWIESAVMDVKR